ncbi:NTP transferase domain-containing protein [Myxococcota bacterium]|nr:NTP transferase domain-containing protein [Myxococcota bacterium]
MPLIVAILAGGRGARMGGVTKPLLVEPSGQRILEHVVADLSSLPDAALVVVAPEALDAPIASVWPGPIVHDPGLGPGAALVAVARTTTSEWILAVGGDQPRASAKLARRLLTHAAPDVDVVRVRLEGAPQTLFALYRRTVLLEHVDGDVPRVALRAVGAEGRVVELDGALLDDDERRALTDVDTPEDAARLGLVADARAHEGH